MRRQVRFVVLLSVASALAGACSSSGDNHPDAAPADGGGDGGSDGDARSDAAAAYPIPTAVKVPAASAPANLPADTHAFCIDPGNDTTFSASCWVVKWGDWTYWVLTYSDSRLQSLITPFDAAGAIAPGAAWPLVKSGARYVMRLSVDENAQTVTIVGQVGNSVTVTWAELRIDQTLPPPPDGGGDAGTDAGADGAGDAPTYDDPTAVPVPRASAPSVVPAEAGVTCATAADDNTPSSSCWVVKWGRWTYWPLSYHDNRSSFLIAPYDATGAIATQAPWPVEKTGARYAWQAAVDTVAQTVTFFGQATGTVTIPWSELRIDQP